MELSIDVAVADYWCRSSHVLTIPTVKLTCPTARLLVRPQVEQEAPEAIFYQTMDALFRMVELAFCA